MNGTSYLEATEFVLRQQFHRDNNVIVDRMGERRITVPGSDQIIESALKKISLLASFWETGEKKLFLKKVSSYLGTSRKHAIIVVEQKLEALAETDASPIVEYMTAMGVVLTLFREKVHENLVKRIIKKYPAMKTARETLEDKLVMSESLLANLAVLERLSAITGITIPREIIQGEISAVVERMMGK